ncbi:hypothetical protein HYFRA_00013000 [Hymenoscyphus fraxineus]|uniref:Uncharacterized protein n=1 Tax=Hymenoscyphus fraxineus TaxID=746836 RepID=A0A9N9PYX9_9HELO|nr:hypothetical protein HYFRA_00013000 [Hymenoscyphus fraxineus]
MLCRGKKRDTKHYESMDGTADSAASADDGPQGLGPERRWDGMGDGEDDSAQVRVSVAVAVAVSEGPPVPGDISSSFPVSWMRVVQCAAEPVATATTIQNKSSATALSGRASASGSMEQSPAIDHGHPDQLPFSSIVV